MLHKSKLDLSEEQCKQSIDLLQVALSTIIDLSLQSKQAHWNIKGMSFFSLHKLFDEIYSKLNYFIDTIAERITSLRGQANSSIPFLNDSTLIKGYSKNILSSKEYLEHMASSLSNTGKYIRQSANKADQNKDLGTSDLFIEVSREIDHFLWLVESHLQ